MEMNNVIGNQLAFQNSSPNSHFNNFEFSIKFGKVRHTMGDLGDLGETQAEEQGEAARETDLKKMFTNTDVKHNWTRNTGSLVKLNLDTRH